MGMANCTAACVCEGCSDMGAVRELYVALDTDNPREQSLSRLIEWELFEDG